MCALLALPALSSFVLGCRLLHLLIGGVGLSLHKYHVCVLTTTVRYELRALIT